ncbi:MAG: hypothetical protein ACK5KT_11735 [Dysgonomonas sp.]
MTDFKKAINTLVNKEVDDCHLLRYKLVESKDSLKSRLLEDPDVQKQWDNKETFSEFKTGLFNVLYSRYILLKDNPLFDKWLYEMYKTVLTDLRRDYNGTTIDNGLRAEPFTAAFKASHLFLSEIFTFDRESYKEILVSEFIEKILFEACSQHYPVEIDRLLWRLKKKDEDFWSVIWHIMDTTARIAVFYNLKTRGKVLINKDKSHELNDWIGSVSQKTYDVLSGKIDDDDTETITDGARLWEYIRSISINVLRNEFKKLMNYEVSMLLPDQDISDTNRYNLPIIDSDGLEDLRKVLQEILYKETPEVYDELIKGLDDEGMAIFRLRAAKLSYDEIIDQLKGSNLPKDEKTTENARLRTCYKRTRDELIARLKKLYMI